MSWPEGFSAGMTGSDSAASVTHIREGSSLYYSFLYTDSQLRNSLLLRLDAILALATALHEVSEPAVAARKLDWWFEEIDRLMTGEARHPALRAVAEDYRGSEAIRRACGNILAVAGLERGAAAPTEAELTQRLVRDYSARLQLLLHPLQSTITGGDPVSWPAIGALAPGLAGVDRLLKLPYLLYRGFAVFSDEQFARHDLSALLLRQQVRVSAQGQPLDHAVDTDVAQRTEALLHAVTAKIRLQLDAALQEPASVAEHPAVLPILIMTRLRERQCRLWLKSKPSLLTERQSLTPLTKYLLAWRCRRQFGKPLG